jgi:hypothetical protein
MSVAGADEHAADFRTDLRARMLPDAAQHLAIDENGAAIRLLRLLTH